MSVPIPAFGVRFTAYIPGELSCEWCCERGKYTRRGLPLPCDNACGRLEPSKPEPSAWDIIVGIPLDAWIGATTVDRLAGLIREREAAPLPQHEPGAGYAEPALPS